MKPETQSKLAHKALKLTASTFKENNLNEAKQYQTIHLSIDRNSEHGLGIEHNIIQIHNNVVWD